MIVSNIEIFQKKKEKDEKSLLIDRISDSSVTYVENSIQ